MSACTAKSTRRVGTLPAQARGGVSEGREAGPTILN